MHPLATLFQYPAAVAPGRLVVPLVRLRVVVAGRFVPPGPPVYCGGS